MNHTRIRHPFRLSHMTGMFMALILALSICLPMSVLANEYPDNPDHPDYPDESQQTQTDQPFDENAGNENTEDTEITENQQGGIPYKAPEAGTIENDGDAVRYTFDDTLPGEDLFNDERARPMDPIVLGLPDGVEPESAIVTEAQSDPRLRVVSTNKLPYSAICKLTMLFLDENQEEHYYVGSGFVIGSNTILTCGHCIYDIQHDLGWIQKIRIEPGRNDTAFPYGSLTSEDVAYMEVDEGWLKSGVESADNALIVLKTNIGKKTGVIHLSTQAAQAKSVHVSGYPADWNGASNDGKQVEDWGGDITISDRCIESDVYGSGGQSGSPMLDEHGWAIGTFAYVYAFRDRSGGPVMDTTRTAWIAEHSDVTDPVYRVYNPNSGEHFYTPNLTEMKHLVSLGWHDEGLAWHSSEGNDAVAVYRLYNPNSGDHHYTLDANEYNTLGRLGWRKEGKAWNAIKETYYHPVYRLYNPNAKTGQHHFTMDETEQIALIEAGWKDEGIAFYAE